MVTSLEVRQADLAGKELRHDGDPQGQDEHDVGDANLECVGQLVGLSADLLYVESQREDDGRHAEEHHGRESHPARVRNHIPVAG